MDVNQLRDVIIKPTLIALGLYSPSAVQLLLGTCAQESQLGKYIVQQTIGFRGGIGIYQMQLPSFMMIWDKMVDPNTIMRSRMKQLLGYEGRPEASRMASDLLLATAMCRLYYAAVNAILPPPNDIPALAQYYKTYYNTDAGKATTDQFIANYKELVITC